VSTALKPDQVCVVAEHTELHERHQKLMAFISSEKFAEVDPDEQARMQRQAALMGEYAGVLRDRIAAFS
jgi:hypothetical protein